MKYKILFVILVVALIFGIQVFKCLNLEFSEPPQKFFHNKSTETVVLLYGTGICENCPPGRFLISTKENPHVLYIVPAHFSDVDIENLKAVFMLKGDIVKGDKAVEKYLKKIAHCKGFDSREKNFIIQLNKNGKITTIHTI